MDAFDISAAGIGKSKRMAETAGVQVNFWAQDLAAFRFTRDYDVILSHGVLHLPEKAVRNAFIREARKHTSSGGYNVISIFTDRRPATPDNAPFTKGLFHVGELAELYGDWEILRHEEGIFQDEHPGGIRHEHAFEQIVARKP